MRSTVIVFIEVGGIRLYRVLMVAPGFVKILSFGTGVNSSGGRLKQLYMETMRMSLLPAVPPRSKLVHLRPAWLQELQEVCQC